MMKSHGIIQIHTTSLALSNSVDRILLMCHIKLLFPDINIYWEEQGFQQKKNPLCHLILYLFERFTFNSCNFFFANLCFQSFERYRSNKEISNRGFRGAKIGRKRLKQSEQILILETFWFENWPAKADIFINNNFIVINPISFMYFLVNFEAYQTSFVMQNFGSENSNNTEIFVLPWGHKSQKSTRP